MMQSNTRYSLRNDSPATCTLRGYPTVRSFTSDGRAVPFAFSRVDKSRVGIPLPLTTQTLRPHQSASVLLGVGYINCAEPHSPGRVVVTLPGDADPLSVPDFYPGVALCPHEFVWVSPVFNASIDPYQH
jgi:hypothetical protein